MGPHIVLLLLLAPFPGATGVVAGAAPPPDTCPSEVSLADVLARTDARPIVGGYAAAIDARRDVDGRISRLHGNTQGQFTSGARWWPSDQVGIEGSIGVSHQARLADLGGSRRAVAERERAVLAAEGGRTRHLLRIESAMAWVNLGFAREHAELMQAQRALAERALDTITRAHQLGVASRADQLRAEAERTAVEVDRIDAEGVWAEAQLSLAEHLHCHAPPAFAAAGASDVRPPELTSVAQIQSVDRPVLDAQASASAERDELASLQERPWLNVGVTSEVDGRNTARTLATVGGSWALFEGDYLDRARERAQRALFTAEQDEAKNAERALFEVLVHDIEHLGEKARLLRGTLVPKLREIEALEEAAVRAGEANADVLLRAQFQRRAAEVQAILAERDFAQISVRAMLWSEVTADEGKAP